MRSVLTILQFQNKFTKTDYTILKLAAAVKSFLFSRVCGSVGLHGRPANWAVHVGFWSCMCLLHGVVGGAYNQRYHRRVRREQTLQLLGLFQSCYFITLNRHIVLSNILQYPFLFGNLLKYILYKVLSLLAKTFFPIILDKKLLFSSTQIGTKC